MQNCAPGDVPIVKEDKFSKAQCPRNELERESLKNIRYASTVGSLMYAQVCTRPDIAYAVSVLSRFQSNPGQEHWKAAKKVMRYLKKTEGYMLTFQRIDHLEVVGYSDSDFAGCQDDLKSTSGYIFMMAGGAISWKNIKQTLVASSTMQVEFVACYGATVQTIWFRNFISGLKVVDSILRPITIYCDNSVAVSFLKNNKCSGSSKHIDIKYLVVRDKVKEGQTKIEHINTKAMIANPLTKRLATKVFKTHIANMGIVETFDVFG
ncbi:secreted RxLR effector protein 161-like [Phoenix dactylifera]|uniref:Secreted RxLR effector protein 161-like n=1 Tax=Phoenix dactylifera TaxID=42345 RepID=A0A8B8ZBA6_PHODC|nr:secreted RxLR effector protein 161-like [Phoenix dactylifera]